jgi:Fur family ferric uptake transcriptional regulator
VWKAGEFNAACLKKNRTFVMSTMESLERLEVALTPQQRFEEYLQSRGMRITQQRKLLVEHVFSRHEHFDADALIEQLPSSGKPGHVSRPTVYRTLNEFVDAGLLRRFILNGRAVYEHDYGYPQHDHMHCVDCNRLFEFQSPELLEIRDRVARESRFRVTGHRLIISGVCQECIQKKRKASSRMNMI